jgi:SAM-dependent methyltransferase
MGREAFSRRAGNYRTYRPGYPPEILRILRGFCDLNEKTVVADIGSGTGIFTRMLLETGAAVYGVEPNPEMRREAESECADFPNFRSAAGTAENTGLPDTALDLITAAQAFHWFHAPEAKIEFQRILKPEGFCVLLWNNRRTDADDFQAGYQELLETLAEYRAFEANNAFPERSRIESFYAPGPVRAFEADHSQGLDWEGLKGRFLSCSYAPAPGQARFASSLEMLGSLFAKYQTAGRVAFRYRAKVFAGRLAKG